MYDMHVDAVDGSIEVHLGCVQMFTRKYQRIAAEHRDEGAVFLEIMGDESADTRVSARIQVNFGLLSLVALVPFTFQQ